MTNVQRTGREQLASGDVEAVRSVAAMLTELEAVWRAGDDGFADMDFNPLPDLPVAQVVMTLEETGAGTRVVFTTTYPSAEALQKVLEMGVIEGATAAMNQIDGVLAAA